jgi:hypothetical protein
MRAGATEVRVLQKVIWMQRCGYLPREHKCTHSQSKSDPKSFPLDVGNALDRVIGSEAKDKTSVSTSFLPEYQMALSS